MSSHFSAKQLADLAGHTISHYEQNAVSFWEGTKDHDVTQNIDCLKRNILTHSPHRILDLGCGPGRDLFAFKEMGDEAIGLDGCAAFCEMARTHTGCDIWHQDFLKLELPAGHFDGIFANAVLFHIPSQEIGRVLKELNATLKEDGVLFCSNPRGNDDEGWNGSRYGTYYSWDTWKNIMTDAHFSEVEHYYRPTGLPREQQPWLASAWRTNRTA